MVSCLGGVVRRYFYWNPPLASRQGQDPLCSTTPRPIVGVGALERQEWKVKETHLDDRCDVRGSGGEDDFMDGERRALAEENRVRPNPIVPKIGERTLEGEELRVPLEGVHVGRGSSSRRLFQITLTLIAVGRLLRRGRVGIDPSDPNGKACCCCWWW